METSQNSLNKCPICENQADKACSGCSSVFYCSINHQKQHWKAHKSVCRPFIIKKNETFGRYLVAARDLPQGTIVLSEEPLIVGPKRTTLPTCLGCHKPVDCSYHCSKCTFPLCNEFCENKPIHAENECLIFQKGHPIGSRITQPTFQHPAYEAVTPLRCLLLRDKNPKKWARLNGMEHHNEIRRTLTALWEMNEINTLKVIREWCKMGQIFDPETIHSVIGFVDVNCFEIKTQHVEICGVYPETGLMAHDCTPNTHHATTSGPNFLMVVRTSIPIKQGEIITTSYVEALTPTLERRSHLKSTKYFDCFCPRCKDPTEFGTFISGVKCDHCAEGYLLPLAPTDPVNDEVMWECRKLSGTVPNQGGCGNNAKYGKIRTLLAKVEKEIASAEGNEIGSRISKLERVLKKSTKLLHPNHSLIIGVIMKLSKEYLDGVGVGVNVGIELMDVLKRKRELCLHLMKVLDFVDPGLSRPRGVTFYHLYKAEFPIAKLQLANGELDKEGFEGKLEEILTYLKTAKETLDLDRLIMDHPTLALRVDDAIDKVYEELNSRK